MPKISKIAWSVDANGKSLLRRARIAVGDMRKHTQESVAGQRCRIEVKRPVGSKRDTGAPNDGCALIPNFSMYGAFRQRAVNRWRRTHDVQAFTWQPLLCRENTCHYGHANAGY